MNPLISKGANIFSTLQILKEVLGHSYKVFEEQVLNLLILRLLLNGNITMIVKHGFAN